MLAFRRNAMAKPSQPPRPLALLLLTRRFHYISAHQDFAADALGNRIDLLATAFYALLVRKHQKGFGCLQITLAQYGF
jgi:hypothetical protein